MNYWVITDTHFGHTKLQEYCGRPVGFERKILEQIRHKVKFEDVLIHLGDFCIGDDFKWHREFMHKCNCRRWLIKGNHDRRTNTWYHINGWDMVADEVTLNVFGKTVVLSHRPVDRPGDYINVHGHGHITAHHPEDKTDGRHRLVFIEHEYSPISLRRIVEGKK